MGGSWLDKPQGQNIGDGAPQAPQSRRLWLKHSNSTHSSLHKRTLHCIIFSSEIITWDTHRQH